MGVVQYLSALALRPVIDGARVAGGDPSADVEAQNGALAARFREHHPRLVSALQQANDRAWLALEIALAGEVLWEQAKASLRRDADEISRQQLRAFLDAFPLVELSSHGPEVRQHCLDELRTARAEGTLSLTDFDPEELAEQALSQARASDPQTLRDGEEQTLDRIADGLRLTNYPALAQLLSIRPSESTSLLVGAFRYYLRKALEADPELIEALALAPLENLGQEASLEALAQALAIAGAKLENLLRALRVVVIEAHTGELNIKAELPRQEHAVQELGEEVLRLLDRYKLDHRPLRAGDGLCLTDEAERQQVQGLLKQFRAFPEERRRQMPALLNGLAKLEVALGDFAEAQRDFQVVLALVNEVESKGEASFNTYQAALECLAWPEALLALQEAVALAPERYAPFPPAKYEPERILGAGGFGVAFLCRNRHSGSHVVLKTLRVDGLERDVAEAFREVRILEELDHPAINRLRDCDYVRGDKQRPFLVMDYFEGQTLADYIAAHGTLSPGEVLALMRPVAEGLHAAHERGVWHRDLKPANLLVRHEGDRWEVKLIDFGMSLKPRIIHAAIASPDMRTRTTVGRSVTAMMNYAAPEQMVRMEGVNPGPYSDVYSFGKICTFALLGNPEPDDEEKAILSEPWRKLLNACSARTVGKRLSNFAVVLEKLAQIPVDVSAADVVAEAPGAPAPQGEKGLAEGKAEPKDAHGFNDRGALYAARGAFDRALVDFNRALELDPKLAQAFYSRGDVYRIKGEYDRAIADFAEALRLDPKYVLAYINQGRAYRLKGEYDRAILDFSKALRVDPKYADAYNNRGNAYADKGEYDRAIADYSEAIRLDPNLYLAYMNRGLAYAKKGEFNHVIADCNEALRHNPKLTAAYFIRGAAFSSKGDNDKAIADFTRVLRLDPKYALAYNDRGLAYAHKGEYDKAIADYTQALRFDSKLALAFMNRAIAHRLKGDNDRSIAELTKLIKIHPKNAVAYTNRGLAYFAKHDHDKAIADFTEALWIDPNNAEAYSRRVEAFRAKGERGKADDERRSRDAVSREERERRQSRATAHFTRAQMHFDNGHFDRAVADFSEALKFDPEDAFIYYNRGLANAAQDEPDKALADYSEAIRRDPKLTLAYYQRGLGYRLRGNYARAIADFTEAIRLDPKLALAYRNRGLAHAALGQQTEAKADYEEAVRIDPSLSKKQ